MFKRMALLSASVLWLAVAPVWAAEVLVGLYLDDSPADAMRIIYQDAEHFRVDLLTDDRTDSFILVNGQRRWLAERNYERNLWEVFDFDMIVAVFRPMPDGETTKTSAAATFSMSGPQTVNGFTGETYSVEMASNADTFKLVLTADTDVAAITRAWVSVVKDWNDNETSAFISALDAMADIERQTQTGYGLLKYENKLVLKSIRRTQYPDNYFELPTDKEIIGPQGLLEAN